MLKYRIIGGGIYFCFQTLSIPPETLNTSDVFAVSRVLGTIFQWL